MLSAPQSQQLEQQGYLLLEKLLPEKNLPTYIDLFESACLLPQHGSRPVKGTRHPLLNAQPQWLTLLQSPAIQACLQLLLPEGYQLHELKGRDPLPGFGEQGLHSDWLPRSPQEPWRVATVLWALDAFTLENGATRVVPGSHQRVGKVPSNYAAPHHHHPQELLICMPAGSALVFNGHLWHSGTRNRSQQARRALQCVYYSSSISQNTPYSGKTA